MSSTLLKILAAALLTAPTLVMALSHRQVPEQWLSGSDASITRQIQSGAFQPDESKFVIADSRDKSRPNQKQKRGKHKDKKWEEMSAEEREQLKKRRKQFESLPPKEREKIRKAQQKYRQLSPAEREALRKKWESMSPEERNRYRKTLEERNDR